MMNHTRMLMLVVALLGQGCLAAFASMSREHILDVAAQSSATCPRSRITILDETYGEGRETSYVLDVCGTQRTYTFVRSPLTGEGEMRDVTSGGVTPICERAIETPGEHVMIAFFREAAGTGRCMDYFASRGWRIVSTRRAHNGDTLNGWGQEVTFQREHGISSPSVN